MLLDDSENLESEIHIRDYQITIAMADSLEVNEYVLTRQIKKLLIKANRYRKTTITLHKPVFQLENPLA